MSAARTLGSRVDAGEIERRVTEIVAARTLYDEAYLLPESHFEGELGIDSVILQSILASVREDFGLTVTPPASVSTIRDLVAAVRAALPAVDVVDELTETVLAVAMRHTQYRREQLDLDADLEGELGIDSVVLTSIIAEAAAELGVAGAPGGVAATTLRGVADELRALVPDVVPAGRDAWDSRSMKDFLERRDPDVFVKAREFTRYLRQREDDRLYWYGMPLLSRCQNRAVIHDELTGRTREFLMFASNNYLGLANHPKVIEAIRDAVGVYGATNTGCRLIGGTNTLHKELERRLAAFKQRPACIVFPGGYSANIGTISALVKSYDTLVVDKLNHMSIVDGGRLSGAIRKIFQHNDMADLERVLGRCDDRAGKLIAVDGVFSMHGDICDLPEIVRLARAHGARVLVDDAHATGVLGARGTGTAEHFGLKGQVDLELGTMSKTLAGVGGFVVGDEDVIEYLRFYANSYVFAATIPAGVAAGLIAALDVMEAEPERIRTLWTNIRLLRDRLTEAGFDLGGSESAILPIVIGDDRAALEMGRAVRARGLFCQTVVFPGVPLGDARLRVSVTSEHTVEDLERAAEIFVDAARETGVLAASRRREPAGAGSRA